MVPYGYYYGVPMLAAAAAIPDTTLKSADKKLALTVPVANLFGSGNDLTSAGKQILENVGKFLKTYANNKVVVRSYTDNRGTAAANQDLSEKRAQKVRDYLAGTQTTAGARVSAEGLGTAEPVAANTTDAGRAQNRRIEINVIKDE